MGRMEMVKSRMEELNKLSDVGLVSQILDYFKKNKTMPGEKGLKTLAEQYAAEFDEGSMTGILSDYRAEITEAFASMLVKEIHVKNVAALNDTKKNRDAKGLRALGLPLSLVDTKPGRVLNTMKNVYEMDAFISGGATVAYRDGDPLVEVELAGIPGGFVKNHPGIEGMKGTIIATDHSNGKFANMSYRMLIDLGQGLAA